MTLWELRQKLELARAQGAEDNALVRFETPTGVFRPADTDDGTEVVAEGNLASVTFERNGRHEIVLR